MITPPAPSTIPASPSTPASSAPSKLPVSKKKLIILISIFLLLLTSAFLIYTYQFKGGKLEFFGSKTKPESSPESSPQSDKPIKPLPKGKQVYSYSHGPLVTGPKPSSATIDPIDPDPNEEQHLSIKVEHDKEVDSAVATVVTDNENKEHKMELISGTKTDGVWETKWKMADTYNYKYQIQYVFKSGNEIHEGALTFR